MKPVIEMFWVAEYFDGQALPQFDPFLKKENSYSHVNHKTVKKFWWIPITPDMTQIFPNTKYNPLLKRHCVELNGSKGFVTRRTRINFDMGKRKETELERVIRLSKSPSHSIECYVLGIEGGPRIEIYPDGIVVNKLDPTDGETQSLLHG